MTFTANPFAAAGQQKERALSLAPSACSTPRTRARSAERSRVLRAAAAAVGVGHQHARSQQLQTQEPQQRAATASRRRRRRNRQRGCGAAWPSGTGERAARLLEETPARWGVSPQRSASVLRASPAWERVSAHVGEAAACATGDGRAGAPCPAWCTQLRASRLPRSVSRPRVSGTSGTTTTRWRATQARQRPSAVRALSEGTALHRAHKARTAAADPQRRSHRVRHFVRPTRSAACVEHAPSGPRVDAAFTCSARLVLPGPAALRSGAHVSRPAASSVALRCAPGPHHLGARRK